ncbi:hypothetical protein Bbelb_142740 [Branchiostoma belcheri]|nr:hypothetical protein Bbelb_142740 [Branchiostoma belcheri]
MAMSSCSFLAAAVLVYVHFTIFMSAVSGQSRHPPRVSPDSIAATWHTAHARPYTLDVTVTWEKPGTSRDGASWTLKQWEEPPPPIQNPGYGQDTVAVAMIPQGHIIPNNWHSATRKI